MDLSQYAELFLAESREHLSACNQLLLEWEADFSTVLADLGPVSAKAPAAARAAPSPPPAGASFAAPSGSGRLVTVTIRAEAPIKGGRATLIIRKAQKLGRVDRIQPPSA